MRVIALERKGLLFFVRKNKIRLGLAAGAVLFVCVTYILSQFVWSVSLSGNIELDEDYILSAFEKQGVYVGAAISSVDNRNAAQQVLSEIEQLSWAAVNRKGTVVVIEVREKTAAPKVYDKSKPTNLIAGEDGLILSVDVLCGNEEIKPGSAVTKGDLLISGVVAYSDGREALVHADGYVRALVTRRNSFNSSETTAYNITTEKVRKKLFIFGIEIPLGKFSQGDIYNSHSSFIENESTMLPLGIITEYTASFSKEKAQLNEESCNMLVLWNSAFYVKELLDFSEVRCVKMTQKNDNLGYEYYLSAECEQEIGVLQEIYVSN